LVVVAIIHATFARLMTTQTLTVELGARSYPIIIGESLLADGYDLSRHLPSSHCLVVTNETVGPLYLDVLKRCLGDVTPQALSLPDGESWKTVDAVNRILDALVEGKSPRDSAIVALGGGVVGDIAGFAAACYMRGIAFIQVPTTLLAQVDSSVGGKTGVNHPGGKNLIGAFHQPRAVIIDTTTLDTLPEREYAAGLAEVIKYGAIIDADFFAWLEDNISALAARDKAALADAIRRSCEIKADVVAADEREAGQRALLNFGHTFGHAIENTMGYGEWLHGEAVAAGMVMAARLSGLDDADIDRLTRLLASAGLPTSPPKAGAAALKDAMQLDKKAFEGGLRFVLLNAIGAACVTSDYDAAALDRVLAAAD
jgi:3-dehydroquinate synthase